MKRLLSSLCIPIALALLCVPVQAEDYEHWSDAAYEFHNVRRIYIDELQTPPDAISSTMKARRLKEYFFEQAKELDDWTVVMPTLPPPVPPSPWQRRRNQQNCRSRQKPVLPSCTMFPPAIRQLVFPIRLLPQYLKPNRRRQLPRQLQPSLQSRPSSNRRHPAGSCRFRPLRQGNRHDLLCRNRIDTRPYGMGIVYDPRRGLRQARTAPLVFPPHQLSRIRAEHLRPPGNGRRSIYRIRRKNGKSRVDERR